MQPLRARRRAVFVWIVSGALCATAWASEPPPCQEKAKTTYEAAVKNDDAAHKTAVERCRTTFPNATQAQSLAGCVSEAGKTHQAHTSQYLDEYNQAKKACDDKVAACSAQAISERTKEGKEIAETFFKEIAVCKKDKLKPADWEPCTSVASAKRDQAEAASKQKYEAAEGRCKKLP